MVRVSPQLLLFLVCAVMTCSVAFSQDATPPPRAREHALAWRANLDSIPELTCEYRTWMALADSVEDAFAWRFRECPHPKCRAEHLFENGTLFKRGEYVMLVVEDDLLGHHVYLRDGYKVRLRCSKRQTDGAYRKGDLATPAGGLSWDLWFSSHYVPHRIMLMGNSISARVDYLILNDGDVSPPVPSTIRCKEGTKFYGRNCDLVEARVEASGKTQWYKYYFDAKETGVLWGAEIVFQDGRTALSRVLTIRHLPSGQWYPTKVVSVSISPDGSLLSEGHVEALEVTRLEPKAPPLDEFQVKIRGTVHLMDLGNAGWLSRQEHTVRADQLQDFVEQMKEAALEKQTALAQGRAAQTVPVGAAATTGPAAPGKTARVRFATYALVGTVAVLVAGGLLLWAQRRGRKRAPEQ